MNKKFLLFIGFVILFNVYYASAAGGQASNIPACYDDFYSSNRSMGPSLSLAVRNNNPIINKGDTINTEVFISGYGHIDNITKIFVTLPIGLVDYNTTYGNDYLFIFNYTTNLWERRPFPLQSPNVFSMSIPADFLQQQRSNESCYQPQLLTEGIYNIAGEWIPPISININTSKNASEGDNKIFLILTYSDGKNWYQDRQEVSVHINSWQEEHPSTFAILVGFIGAVIVAGASLIWHFVEIRYKEWEKGRRREKIII